MVAVSHMTAFSLSLITPKLKIPNNSSSGNFTRTDLKREFFNQGGICKEQEIASRIPGLHEVLGLAPSSRSELEQFLHCCLHSTVKSVQLCGITQTHVNHEEIWVRNSLSLGSKRHFQVLIWPLLSAFGEMMFNTGWSLR